MANYFISGAFPKLLKLPTRAKNLRKTLEEVVFHSEEHGTFITPIGFVTDQLSIPWFIPIPQAYDTDGPAVVHDTCYAFQNCTREVADKVFLEALLANGVGKAKAYTLYAGVRVGGWVGWNKAKKQKAENRAAQ